MTKRANEAIGAEEEAPETAGMVGIEPDAMDDRRTAARVEVVVEAAAVVTGAKDVVGA